MNPLGNGNLNMLPPQLRQNIQQIKQMMNALQNPNAILQQNPMLNQLMQTDRGQDPQQIFRSLCQQKGVDPDAIIKELRS